MEFTQKGKTADRAMWRQKRMPAVSTCYEPKMSLNKHLKNSSQVVDENGQEVEKGKEGNYAVKIKPSPRAPIFTEYLVSSSDVPIITSLDAAS